MGIAQATAASTADLVRSQVVLDSSLTAGSGKSPSSGEKRSSDGADYIYYDGYWVRYYQPLDESLASRKTLIDHLTRRAFHHTEPGINTPGERLDMARSAYGIKAIRR